MDGLRIFQQLQNRFQIGDMGELVCAEAQHQLAISSNRAALEFVRQGYGYAPLTLSCRGRVFIPEDDIDWQLLDLRVTSQISEQRFKQRQSADGNGVGAHSLIFASMMLRAASSAARSKMRSRAR